MQHEFFGSDMKCKENWKRISNTHGWDKTVWNKDIPDEPEKWRCEWCEEKLYAITRRICCGVHGRKRREAATQSFWFGDEIKGHQQVTEEQEKALVEHIAFHREADDGCKKQKPGDTDHLDKHIEAVAPMKTQPRKKRGVLNQYLAEPIRRSTLKEINEIIECPKRAKGFLVGTKKYNRPGYHHTSVHNECCGSSTCDLAEIKQSYLQEECCGEGCRVEEIYESCHSWKWDENL